MAAEATPESDRFAEKTTAYLRNLAARSPAIRAMYEYDGAAENIPANRDADLFLEKKLTRVKGVVCKYPGRAIVLLSYTCAANCRYCERQDRVGVGLDEEGRLTPAEIAAAVQFVAQRPEIAEVIFSGGDPLTHPQGLLAAARGHGRRSPRQGSPHSHAISAAASGQGRLAAARRVGGVANELVPEPAR